MNKHSSEREQKNIDAPKVITLKFFFHFFGKLPGIALNLTGLGNGEVSVILRKLSKLVCILMKCIVIDLISEMSIFQANVKAHRKHCCTLTFSISFAIWWYHSMYLSVCLSRNFPFMQWYSRMTKSVKFANSNANLFVFWRSTQTHLSFCPLIIKSGFESEAIYICNS